MSQRKRSDKRNEIKIYKSYPSTLDSSLKDSNPRIKSVSYSSGDEEVNKRNHSSRKSHFGKPLKSPLVLRKDSDSNDSGFRKYSDYTSRLTTKNHHHLNDEGIREENHCHKNLCHQKNKCENESYREKKYRILENDEHFKRFSFTEVNKFSPEKSSVYNLWNKDFKKNRRQEEEKQNTVSEIVSWQKENKEIEEYHLEGSARTRGFYFRKECQNKNNIDSNFQNKVNTENEIIEKSKDQLDYSTKLENFRNVNQTSNEDLIVRRQNKKRCQSVESKNQSRKGNESRSRRIENSSKKCLESKAKSSFHSFDSKNMKTQKKKENKKQEKRISNIKQENVLKKKNVLSSDTEGSSISSSRQENDKNSSTNNQQKQKIREKKSVLDSPNREKRKSNRKKDSEEKKTVTKENNYSNIKFDEDSSRRQIQETKKNKITSHKRKYENDSNYKKKTLRYLLMYLLRKIIHEEKKNEERIKISKRDSCIKLKQDKLESNYESSGYDSLKNIQDRISEKNKGQISEFIKNSNSEATISDYKSEEQFLNFFNYLESENLKKSCNEIEFLDLEKYCVYKIYKCIDGSILLKESQSQELKKGEYVIGKRISKEPEKLGFAKKLESEMSKIDPNQLLNLRNNSTQTELEMPNINKRKQSWFRKSYRKRPLKSKKYLTSLDSTSNSSFQETSDFEQFNLPFRKNRIIYSPYSKQSLLKLSKSSAQFLKKSAAVDTSDLSNYSPAKNFENKHVFLFYSPENGTKIESNTESRFLNLDVNSDCEKIKLEQIKPIIIENKREYYSYLIKKDDNYCSSSLIPIFWLKFDNFEFFTHKNNVEEIFGVQMKNNSNSLSSTELLVEKPKLINSEASVEDLRLKKKTRTFLRVFKRKKK